MKIGAMANLRGAKALTRRPDDHNSRGPQKEAPLDAARRDQGAPQRGKAPDMRFTWPFHATSHEHQHVNAGMG